MKRYLIVLIFSLVVVITVMGLNVSTVKAAGNTIPTCSVILPSKVRIGKEATGTIYCRSDNGFNDVSISKSDLIVESSCLTKAKITYISEGASSNGNEYYWKFTIKGRLLGRFGVQLLGSSVSSSTNVGNWMANSYSKVTLF